MGPTAVAEEIAVKPNFLPTWRRPVLFAGLQKLRGIRFAGRARLWSGGGRSAARPVHANLAAIWNSLGYDQKAADAAKKAFDLSAGLRHEERLRVEGQYHEVSHEWDKAVETYRSLYQASPDNLDYGLSLANAQISAGKVKDALETWLPQETPGARGK